MLRIQRLLFVFFLCTNNNIFMLFYVFCVNRTIATGREGLLILLRRMVYPNRLYELSQEFGRHESELSLIFNTVLHDLYQRFGCKLTDLNQAWWFNLERLSCTRKGSLLSNCSGFIDGTCTAICRPSTGQRACYLHCGEVNEDQHEFNKVITGLSKCVEWDFGQIKSQFAFLDLKNNLKLHPQPVAKYFLLVHF